MEIVSREAAGLVAPKPGMSGMLAKQVDKQIAHHSDEPPPTDPHAAHPEAHDLAAGQWRSIQAYHMNSRGFDDIAYHFGIAPDGAVYEGRGLTWVGAHAGAQCNPGSVGVCVLMQNVLTDPAKRSFLALRDHLVAEGYNVEHVEPHSECNPTYCPSDVFREWIAAGLPEPGEASAPEPGPAPTVCSQLAPGPPPHGLPMLKPGDHSTAVAWLQQRLTERGDHVSNSLTAAGRWDGIYGPATLVAVRQLQNANGLKADGIVGRQTYCALGVR